MTADAQDAHFVVFAVEGQRHAVELSRVSRVFPAVEVSPLAGAPPVVAGVVNVHGAAVATVDMRARLGLPPRPLELADHFLLVATRRRALLLITDAVRDVLLLPRELVRSAVAQGNDLVTAMLRTESGVLFVDDVDRLLSAGEEMQLEAALSSGVGGTA